MTGASLLRMGVPRLPGSNNRLRIGSLSRFPVNSYTYLADARVYIYRDHEGISAVSAVCTHLGCTIRQSDDGFLCPCHGSCYDVSGKVVSGAASRNLPWFRITRDGSGQLVLDVSDRVGSGYKCPISP